MESVPAILKDKLEEGQKALEQTEWTQARECFESVVCDEEIPEAFELLGRAAWWLDDAETALHAREKACRLYREQGDCQSAARVAIALAYDYLSFRGEHVISNGWSRRAHRLLEGLDLVPEHGWIKAWDGNVAIEVDHDPETALRFGKKAVEIARKLNDFDLEMMGIALEGLAMVCMGQIDTGMQHLDEAATASVSGEISDLAVSADVCCYLITACEWVQDYSRAVQWCYNVKRTTGDGKYPLMFSLCQIHYTSVLIWRGDWDEAEELLKEATDNLLVSRPAHAAEGLVRRADLFRRRGRYSEVARLLKKVEKKPFRVFGANYLLLAKAALAFDRGQLETAENLAERYLRHTPEQSRLMIPEGLRLLASVQAELGYVEAASETAARLRSIADVTGTEPIHASANLAEGNVLMSNGDYEGACRKFERSVELYRMSGNPYETARAQNDLALVLYHLDKKNAAEKVAASALETFRELGAFPAQKRSESILEKIKSRNQDHSDKSHPDAFTERELEILCEVARGKSNPEIASDHFISIRTVERHISNIYSKLGVSGRAARATATAYAYQNDLLD
jgi:LuxR family transcriptional regulator, maltose regulon positive regulatory protein